MNRAQYTSIFDDLNYRSALQYADVAQRVLYESEAKAINEIQKGILEISQKEIPFDVFICYKETDLDGRRTQDSVLAQDLYYQLKQEGFKVFFSRITLEDKLGTAYEPYIFAALNSAKVMVVVGTKPEFFNAVWVKNEWSRYLALIKQGQKKVLIPAYKDMNPYDLPEEFSHLQAQDMSKLGFMQDLIRGINKLAKTPTPQATVVKETKVVQGTGANVDSLLKRVFMFLEDGDWSSANEYCEKVLDIDPECARAYLGKLMVERKVKLPAELGEGEELFDASNQYAKIKRFGDKVLLQELEGYLKTIQDRIKEKELAQIYQQASRLMDEARRVVGSAEKAAELFRSLPGYRDADARAEQCVELARELAYDDALSMFQNAYNIPQYKDVMQRFERLKDYKKSFEMVKKCEERLAELEQRKAADEAAKAEMRKTYDLAGAEISRAKSATDEEEKLSHYREALKILETIHGYSKTREAINHCFVKISVIEEDRKERAQKAAEEARRKKAKKIKIIASLVVLAVICLVVGFAIVWNYVIAPASDYKKAVALLEEGKYFEAWAAFAELGDYENVAEKRNEIKNFLLKNCKPGDYILFGSYEQDAQSSNGAEPLEWLVLDVQDGKALVITKHIIDEMAYSDYVGGVQWNGCFLRKWLNDQFLNTTFSEAELKVIPTVLMEIDMNENYKNDSSYQVWGTGDPTLDRVFLLSIEEYERYFLSASEAICTPVENVDHTSWWLRTRGKGQRYAATVDAKTGKLSHAGEYVSDVHALRPAMWIDLTAIQ